MTEHLDGRVVIVTGGSRGLGRAMARSFARNGARVMVASRNAEACEETARELTSETGREALGVGFHVGHWDEAEGLLEATVARFGRIDVLVNNAGMSPLYDDLESVTEPLWDKVFDVNLKGPFRLATLAAGEIRRTAGSGSIINISSMASQKPRVLNLPYAAAKAGLNTMTVGMAHAFGPEVRVNAILAGTFMTDVSKSWDADAFAERAAGFALRRGGQPEEICGAALYLATDASSYTTGSLITVDGGQP